MVDIENVRSTPSAAELAATIRTDSLARRVVDVVLALLGLAIVAPLLLLLAAAIRLDSRGPVLFRQVRVGQGARPFTILKFRTMTWDPGGTGAQVSGRRDPRVTRLGTLLRASRLDELPQLVNVLRGDMTFIGPRPEVPRYVAHYSRAERAVLDVRPGLAGAGQLLFLLKQSSELDAAQDGQQDGLQDGLDVEQVYVQRHLHPKLALDLAYLARRGLVADLRLSAITVLYLAGLYRGRAQ